MNVHFFVNVVYVHIVPCGKLQVALDVRRERNFQAIRVVCKWMDNDEIGYEFGKQVNFSTNRLRIGILKENAGDGNY